MRRCSQALCTYTIGREFSAPGVGVESVDTYLQFGGTVLLTRETVSGVCPDPTIREYGELAEARLVGGTLDGTFEELAWSIDDVCDVLSRRVELRLTGPRLETMRAGGGIGATVLLPPPTPSPSTSMSAVTLSGSSSPWTRC